MRAAGDKERDLGLPISAFMDRQQVQVTQCQLGFINVLVKPLFLEWHKLLGDMLAPAMAELEAALKCWGEEGEAPAAGWERESSIRP